MDQGAWMNQAIHMVGRSGREGKGREGQGHDKGETLARAVRPYVGEDLGEDLGTDLGR